MTQNIRFPFEQNTGTQQAENNLVITLLNAATLIPEGGSGTGAPITPWRFNSKLSPFTQIVIEIIGSEKMTLNDGSIAQAIGLYGRRGATQWYLLGVLGYNLGATMPQVQIAAADIGFAQIVNYVPVYDQLAIGGIFGNISVPGEGPTITVTARPIFERDYIG